MEAKKLIHDAVIKSADKHGVRVVGIILFGSRARGDFRPDSDWDVLIVTARPLNWEERLAFTGEIRKTLAKKGLATDILVISKDELEKVEGTKEYIYHYALREGVRI